MTGVNDSFNKSNILDVHKDYLYFYNLRLNLCEKKKSTCVMLPEGVILCEINSEHWNKALTSAINSLTIETYPHYIVTQNIIEHLLNGDDNIDIGLAEEFFWKLLLTIPPESKMTHYYRPIILNNFKTVVGKNTQSLLFILIDALTDCLKKEPNSNNEPQQEISKETTFPTRLSVHSRLNSKTKMKRYMIVLKFVCDILECDFASWAHSNKLKSPVQSQPLLSLIFWQKKKNIGSLNNNVRKILQMYKLVTRPNKTDYKIQFIIQKLITLLGEVIRCSDNQKNNNSGFGIKCDSFTKEISGIIYRRLTKNGLNENGLIVNFKPPWLRLLLSSQLLSMVTGSQCPPELSSACDILEYVAYMTDNSTNGKVLNKVENLTRPDVMQKLKKKKTENGKTLHSACEESDIETVKALLSFPELDVNAKNADGWTALHVAASVGDATVVRELLSFTPQSRVLQNSLNTRARGPNDYTPLMCAVLEQHADVCQLLLEHTGSVLLQDVNKSRQTSLELSKSEKVTKILEHYKENDVPTANSCKDFDFLLEFKEIVIRLSLEMIQAYFSTYKTVEINRAVKNQENSSLRTSLRQLKNKYNDYFNRNTESDIKKLKSLSPKLAEVQEFKKSVDVYNQILSFTYN